VTVVSLLDDGAQIAYTIRDFLLPVPLSKYRGSCLNGRQQYLSDQASREDIPIGGGVALGVAFGTLATRAVIMPRLLYSRDDADHAELDRIQTGLPRQLELLLSGQRKGVSVISNEEVKQDTKEALLFLFFDLFVQPVRFF